MTFNGVSNVTFSEWENGFEFYVRRDADSGFVLSIDRNNVSIHEIVDGSIQLMYALFPS